MMIQSRGPTVVRVHSIGGYGGNGVNCCCVRCCTCCNLNFLKSEPGILKLAEAILGSFCQSLVLNFGMQYAGTMGPAYHSFLTTTSWCLMTTLLLLFCYLFSEKSINMIRQSFFETAFNIVAAFSYISSCSYLGFSVNTVLYPLYLITPFFQVYPAMTGAYIMGAIVGIIHGYDAYKAYRYFKGYR